MNKQDILVRNFYGVSNQVFNVGEGGVAKTHFDPINKRSYIYASANNVKHCVREEYESKLNLKGLETFFEKVIKLEHGVLSIKQGGVGVNINMNDYKSFIFGLWCSLAIGGKDVKKYESITIKSVMNIGEFKPVHTLLSTVNKHQGGVNSGNNNSKVCFSFSEDKGDRKYYTSVNEFLESNPKFDTEDYRDIIGRENRTMNIFGEDAMTANGLYSFDTTINMNVFGKINLSTFNRDNKEIEKDIMDMIENKGFKIQNIKGVDYLVPPMETIVEMWYALVESLYEWDFKSNNSTHGSVNQLFRSTFSLNNPSGNLMSTYGELVDEGKAKLVINDDIDGVKTYNSVLLSQYINTKEEGIETSTMAILNAMQDLKEMGVICIKNAYCE